MLQCLSKNCPNKPKGEILTIFKHVDPELVELRISSEKGSQSIMVNKEQLKKYIDNPDGDPNA